MYKRQVQISRVQNGGLHRHHVLFGSSVRTHPSSFILRIAPGQRTHKLSSDWYRATGAPTFIEVELSATQFADLLTTMNMGDGTPCTIRRLGGKLVESPPDAPIEAQLVEDGFQKDMQKLALNLANLSTLVEEVLGKKSITVADRNEIRERIRRIVQEVASNYPFVLRQFTEATAKVVSAAKAEVDSWTTTMAHRLGIQHLSTLLDTLQPPNIEMPQLTGAVLPPLEGEIVGRTQDEVNS